MKKINFLLLALIPIMMVQAGNIEKVFTFSSYSIQQMGNYQAVTFGNTLLAGLTGEPVLPYHSLAMLLPPGEKAVSMEIIGEQLTQIPGFYELYPQQTMQPLSKGPDGNFVRNDAIYKANRNYPDKQSGKLINAYLNGYSFALSTFTPVTCNPAQKTLSYYGKVTVRILTAPDPAATEALANSSSSESVMNRVKMFAQNPEMMQQYPLASAPVSNYQILIITPSQFQSGFQPLVDFYSSRGIATEITTTEGIAGSASGQDLQEKIRNYIKSEYQANGIEHVILGGDVEYIPFRGFYCYVVSGSGYEDYNIPADLYYSALDGNWNTNGDSKWGEPGEDDLLPEISVGRMSFSNSTELGNMVHKSVTYQTNPGSWEMNKPYLVSEFLYDPPMTWGSDYLELLVDDHSDNGYFTNGIPSVANNITRLYDAPGFNWSTGQLLNEINAGKSFIHHCGHSNATYMMRLNNWDITNTNFSQVNGIANNYQLMYTHGCICGAFDENDCIAEVSTTISNFLAGGIFNSRYGWFNQGQTEGPSAHLHREFISAVYNPAPGMAITELGAAHTMSKIKTAPWIGLPGEFEPGAQRWCFYDCNVLGDPALKVWRNNPSVSVTSNTSGISVLVSPNPCQDLLSMTIHTNTPTSASVTLVNSLGQTVYSGQHHFNDNQSTVSINVSSLTRGIYFCRVSTPELNLVEKVILTK